LRLVIGIEAHLVMVQGQAYSSYLHYDAFWYRYRQVFDEVLLISRATEAAEVPAGYQQVTKNGVGLVALPRYHGPYQYVRYLPKIREIIRQAVRPGDAVLLRVSGNVSTQLWKQLEPDRPYGVEVMSDPWVLFSPGSIKSVGRPLYRRLWTRNMQRQCAGASAVSYNTEYTLQKRYPPNPNAFTNYYSDVYLSTSELCADLSARRKAIESIAQRLRGEGAPIRLGFIGTFSQIHKLPNVHIKALARCVARGANVCLDMIGDGYLLDDMKVLAEKLGVGDRVTFRGRIPAGAPIFQAMDSFDLFLNAAAAEGLPRVVIEALARGCPCIASDVAGTCELLEAAYLVQPHDVEGLANKILFMLDDPARLARAAETNLRRARQYCSDILEPRRQAFYEALRERTEAYPAGPR